MPNYIKDGGTWKPATAYVRDGGVWKLAATYTRDAGTWKLSDQLDTTPPPVPTLTVGVVDYRYLTVGVGVGATDVADLVMVRVLISTDYYPATPFSSGYVHEADIDYLNETWSDWDYDTNRPNSASVTYKEYPPNATDETVLPGNTYYYVSAFAKDSSGNWSAGAQARVFLAAVPVIPGTGDPAIPPPVVTDPGDGSETPTEPVPTVPGTPTTPGVDTRTSYTKTYAANWSRSYADGEVLSFGETLAIGNWPNLSMPAALVGFPETEIMRDLVGAEITKVEVRLRSREMLATTGGTVQFQFHAITDVPDTMAGVGFGSYVQSWGWPDFTTRWLDITANSPNQWKTGDKVGLVFRAASTHPMYAVKIAGHRMDLPPLLRITYKK